MRRAIGCYFFFKVGGVRRRAGVGAASGCGAVMSGAGDCISAGCTGLHAAIDGAAGVKDADLVALRIGAQALDTRVECWVEDEGPGPAAAEAETIFARFRRGSEEEPEPGGLGLGLWIVKSIIDRHAGTIALVRTAAGRTRFTLSLPRELSE